METQNKQGRKKYIKEERVRLNKLSSMTYRFDPRIRAEKKRIEDEEAKIKQEKFEKREAERKLKEDIISVLAKNCVIFSFQQCNISGLLNL